MEITIATKSGEVLSLRCDAVHISEMVSIFQTILAFLQFHPYTIDSIFSEEYRMLLRDDEE
jgi:hypothetical protein